MSALPLHTFDSQAKIKVIGIGGAGGNAVNRMVTEGMKGVEFISMNTDEQVLGLSKASVKLRLGLQATRGLGAGGDPIVGEKSAKESEKEICAVLEGADMVFITAGMGGGTGTGAAPYVAELARRMGILTVGVVSKPFSFEGPKRKRIAEQGSLRLTEHVDTLIVVPNDRLIHVVDRNSTMGNAFATADDVLRQGVQGISDIILKPGMINVDFADVSSVMRNAGVAVMGMGRGIGDQRARIAAEHAANSPLLETQIQSAKKLLVNITSGEDFSIGEAGEAMDYLHQFIDPEDAEIFMGHVMDPSLGNEVLITVLAAGMGKSYDKVVDAQVFPEQLAAPVAPSTTTPEDLIKFVDREPVAVAGQKEPQKPIQIEELDLDIPTFLRRQRS
jgi:cell division protein FtsZ